MGAAGSVAKQTAGAYSWSKRPSVTYRQQEEKVGALEEQEEKKEEAQEEKKEHEEKVAPDEDLEEKLTARTGDLEVTKTLVGALIRKPKLNRKPELLKSQRSELRSKIQAASDVLIGQWQLFDMDNEGAISKTKIQAGAESCWHAS
jgi:hypothetical protein